MSTRRQRKPVSFPSALLDLTVLGLAAVAVSAAAAGDTSRCAAPEYSQPFLYAGDEGSYRSMPGDTVDDFSGEGWQLSGGAQIVSTTLADGDKGWALELPRGSKAVSPAICATNSHASARAIVRHVKGSGALRLYVEYQGPSRWASPQSAGQFHAQSGKWALASARGSQPHGAFESQPERITLLPGPGAGKLQLYDLYLDRK